LKNKLFYGFGSLSYSIISQTMSNFFMFFATTVVGISGTLVGIAIAISTIWDGVADTLVGYLSDNFKVGHLGYRRGYMVIASIGMSISNIALWCIPNSLSLIFKFVWMLFSLLIIETFNAMFSTPYMALGNEIAKSSHDRTKTNASSTIFYLIGIIIPSVLLYIFLPNTNEYPIGQLNPKGYINIAITTSIICLVFGLLSALFTKDKNIEINKKEIFNIKHLFVNFCSAFKEVSLRKIIIGYVLTTISTVFLCSVGLHFFTYSFFYSSKQITILLVTLMLGTILSQPLWVKISKNNKKKSALIGGIFITIASVFMVILIYLFRIEIYNISFYLMVGCIFICGVGSGALYGLPTSLYGDAIMGISKNSSTKTATYSGALTFASSIANSITQFLVGVMLDLIGFDSTMQVQSLSVQMGLSLILFIIVQLSLILACGIFVSYREKIK